MILNDPCPRKSGELSAIGPTRRKDRTESGDPRAGRDPGFMHDLVTI
jgi:hypothetical protein